MRVSLHQRKQIKPERVSVHGKCIWSAIRLRRQSLSEPRDMVHPVPDSSDGGASGTDQRFKGEHLLAAAQGSMPRNGGASSSTEIVGIPAGATGWSLAGRVDGWYHRAASHVCTCRSAANNKCDTRGNTHGEMDGWWHWCANQRTSRIPMQRGGG